MGDENPIRTLGDYSKPSHEGYRNSIELPVGTKCDWLECLLAGSITTWEDLTTRFLAQFFFWVKGFPGWFYGRKERRTAKLRNDILIFQQHHGESLFEAWTRFKDLLQKVPHHGIDLWLQVQIFYDHVNPVTRRTIDQSTSGKLRDRNAEGSWALLEDLALYDNESWNDPRDFAKPVKAIALPQDVPSTSDRRLIELENQVQRLMEAHLAPTQPTQVNKITTSCEICSGPYDTQYCMEDPEQAFVKYASSRTDEAGGKWYTFKPEQNNLGDTYNPSWNSHPNLRWRQPQNSQNNFSNPPNRLQPNSSIPNCSFNNNPQSFNNQSNLEGLVSNFMASQDARLSKFEADFKQQQILSARSYPTEDPQCSTQTHGSINAITIHTKQQSASYYDKEKKNKEEEDDPKNIHVNPPTPPDSSVTFITEKVLKLNSFFESLGLVPPSSNTELICTKEEDGDVIFIEIVPKEEPETREQEVEYFDIFPTRSELVYHKYLMCGPIPLIFLRNPVIMEECPSNLKIPCNIRHVHVEKAYIDLNSPLNIMTQMMYNWIMRRKLDPRENANEGVSNFTGRIKGMHVFVGNFTYIIDFMIIEDINSIIDPRLS
ncbi:hypothetical protein Tco_0467755 [Tanacetum coccineum]